jgi:hypothetical protein
MPFMVVVSEGETHSVEGPRPLEQGAQLRWVAG